LRKKGGGRGEGGERKGGFYDLRKPRVLKLRNLIL